MSFCYWWGIPADLLDVLIRTICWIILCMESILVAENGSRLRPAVWLHLDAESLRAVNHMIVVNATGSHKLYIFIVIYIWQCLFSQFEAYLIKHLSKWLFSGQLPTMYRWKLTITTTWTSQKIWGMFMMNIKKWNIPFAKKTDVRVFLLANPFLQSNHL